MKSTTRLQVAPKITSRLPRSTRAFRAGLLPSGPENSPNSEIKLSNSGNLPMTRNLAAEDQRGQRENRGNPRHPAG